MQSPVAVRPETLSARPALAGRGSDGSVTIDGRSGVVGSVAVSASALVGATPMEMTLALDPIDVTRPAPGARGGTAVSHHAVRPGTAALRFEVSGNERDDVDLFVYRRGTLVASSAGPGSAEGITIAAPAPGRYDVYVNAFAAADGVSAAVTFTGWVLAADPSAGSAAGSLTLTPDPVAVSLGAPCDYTASWSRLDPAERWFAMFSYGASDATTYLTVN